MKDFLFRAKRKDNGEYIEGLPYYGLEGHLKVYAAIIPFGEVPTGEDQGKKFSDTWEMQEVEEDTLELIVMDGEVIETEGQS